MQVSGFKKLTPSIIVLLVILGMFLALRRLDILWLVLGIISFLLILGVIKVEEIRSLKWELVALLLVPLFLGMSGISSGLENQLLGIDVAFVMISPTIGFMVMFNLHHHTSFKVNFPFAIFFVFVFSLASGGLIGIGEFLSDLYLGTNFLRSNYDLMMDLIAIALGSIPMGLFFTRYIRKSKYDSIQSLTSPLGVSTEKTSNKAVEILFSGFGHKGNNWAPLLSRSLQILILIFAMLAIYWRNPRWFFSSILSFGVTLVPRIFTKNMNIVIPPLLNLWICGALFLHVIGGVMGFYDDVFWWDHLTHFVSAALISILGFTILLTITRLSDTLHIPNFVIPIIILLFILATGVVWEIFEFFADELLGTHMQYGLEDTAFDMIYNIFGAGFASLVGYRYFLSEANK